MHELNDDCLFCKILTGKIPSTKIYENTSVVGFLDLHPEAPFHALFIHKGHTKNVNELMENEMAVIQIFKAIKDFTTNELMEEEGFRIVTNIGKWGGQSVFHTHFHVLGKGQLGRFGA